MILRECLPQLGKDLLEEIEEHSPSQSFLAQEYVIKQGDLVRFLPVVTRGSVKVTSHEDSVQFLLYYVTAGETCIFSFAHLFNEEPIGFSAVAELDSEVLLLPLHKVREWHTKYPRFSCLLISAYQKHYEDLLQTTKQLICYNLDHRLASYLKKKAAFENSAVLSTSHQDIANDLGTSREVITRIMKKLVAGKQVEQIGRKIKVLQ